MPKCVLSSHDDATAVIPARKRVYTHTMGPKRNSGSTTEADVSGRIDDDALALRIIELLNDDAVVSKLKNALYPQVLADKLDQQTAQIDRLLAQLTESKTRIEQLESRVGELEDQADHTEQYSRRANLIFTGMTETGSGENVEEKMLAVINETMALRPFHTIWKGRIDWGRGATNGTRAR